MCAGFVFGAGCGATDTALTRAAPSNAHAAGTVARRDSHPNLDGHSLRVLRTM